MLPGNRRQHSDKAILRPAARLLAIVLVVWGGWPANGHSTSLQGADRPAARTERLFFTSHGKTAIVRADGQDLKYFEFDKPGQATWQPGPSFSDGKRVLFLSMEPRRDGPGKPFDEYYTQTPTHLWVHDLDAGTLEEVCDRERLAPFVTPALLVGDERLLIQVVRNRVGQIFSVRIDGTDPREFTRAGEGLPYGFSLSPDGRRVAFHLASPQGYQIWTSDLVGSQRVLVAAKPGHLYFGTSWSPDGQWILYVDCLSGDDPGHDWADVCIGRADGSEHRVLTTGQAMWFAATYGSPQNRGGGSNVPGWTRDGQILCPRRLPGSKVPWEFQAQRPDTDHFNRDFKPELARGGTEICRLDPQDGSITVLTHSDPPVWDFRATESPDGKWIAFCRAETGEPPGLWVMDAQGGQPQLITRGVDDLGADHPRWLPLAPTARRISLIQEAGPERPGSPEIRAARNALAAEGVELLPRLLEAMDASGAVAANVLRTAFDEIVSRNLEQQDAPWPIDQLKEFLANVERRGRPRRLALALIDRLEPGFAEQWMVKRLADPEFRHEAVARALLTGEQALASGGKDAARQAYRQAFEHARDGAQVVAAANALVGLGEQANSQTQLGLVGEWWVVGPFDAPGKSGFGTLFEPERQIDLLARYAGQGDQEVTWKRYRTQDPLGQCNLIEALGNASEAVGYAYTEIDVLRASDCELRCSADDNCTVWLNGRRVFGREMWLNGTRFDRFKTVITLAAGRNTLLVKVCQGPQHRDPEVGNAWSLQIRLCDASGRGIEFRPAPPEGPP
ncbi:MAG: hypothetical protein ACKV0T_01245 [Planctomycetales bacterium]